MPHPLRRLRRWLDARTNHTDDPFADALQLRRRQQAIRRTLAEVRAESTVRRAAQPDGESIAELRRVWS